MLKSKFLLLTVISSITLVSCKKESLIANSVMPSPSDVRVKTKTEGNNVETYYYDSKNQLSKIVFSSSSAPSYYHEFVYSASIVSEYHSEEPRYELQQSLPNGAVKVNCSSNPSLLKLNTDGFYTGASSYCQSQSYKYDASGFVVAQDYSMIDYSTNEQLQNDKKNITQISGKGYSFGGGEFIINTTYTYYLDKANTIGNINFGKSFFGKSSENLVKTETKNNETINYTYTFDAKQRVFQQTAIKGNIQTITTYTYY